MAPSAVAILVEKNSVAALELPDGLRANLEVFKLLLGQRGITQIKWIGQSDIDLPVVLLVPVFDQGLARSYEILKGNHHISARRTVPANIFVRIGRTAWSNGNKRPDPHLENSLAVATAKDRIIRSHHGRTAAEHGDTAGRPTFESFERG